MERFLPDDRTTNKVVLTYQLEETMTLTAALLGAILLVVACGGIFVYRALLAIVRLLEQINRQLMQINGNIPSSGLITSLLSI